ncbi:WAS/WASL-interacting protein [Streptomyces sp. Ncost-T6T-2b]|nr:WAS/WASL-interacting protein [Streptomyces sp. Ncost-T6T-2b]
MPKPRVPLRDTPRPPHRTLGAGTGRRHGTGARLPRADRPHGRGGIGARRMVGGPRNRRRARGLAEPATPVAGAARAVRAGGRRGGADGGGLRPDRTDRPSNSVRTPLRGHAALGAGHGQPGGGVPLPAREDRRPSAGPPRLPPRRPGPRHLRAGPPVPATPRTPGPRRLRLRAGGRRPERPAADEPVHDLPVGPRPRRLRRPPGPGQGRRPRLLRRRSRAHPGPGRPARRGPPAPGGHRRARPHRTAPPLVPRGTRAGHPRAASHRPRPDRVRRMSPGTPWRSASCDSGSSPPRPG